jgi:hypothetical protein
MVGSVAGLPWAWLKPALQLSFRERDDHATPKHRPNEGFHCCRDWIFSRDLNVPLCARAMMVALRGIGYQSGLPRRKVDELLSELAAQTERWITAEDAPQ